MKNPSRAIGLSSLLGYIETTRHGRNKRLGFAATLPQDSNGAGL
jgi:hypothetical protein